jgi:hypothetical protein
VKKLLYLLVFLAIAFIVWRSPHWHSLNIHDVTAFRAVLLLGVFQTIVAIYGGCLAVLTLKPEERGWHSFLFVALGVILFGLTFWVGLLNDKTQYELQSSLNNSTAGLTNVSAALPNLKTCDLSGIDKIQTYIAGVLRSTSNRSASPPPPLVVPQVLVPSTTPQPTLTTPADMSVQLLNYGLRLQKIGEGDLDSRQESYKHWHPSEARDLSGTSLRSDPQPTPEQKEKDEKSYNAEMAELNAQEVARYTAIEVEMRKALSDAYVALNFSEAKKKSEFAIFNKLSDSAKRSIPNATSNRLSPYQDDYTRIARYLNSIGDQLDALKK